MDKSHEELLACTDEERELFNLYTEGLPSMDGINGDGLDKFGVPIPYGSQAHIIKHFKKTLEIVKPKLILEIGFNCGHSAALWLNLSNAVLVSVDISEKDETILAAQYLKEKFASRFHFKFRKDCIDLIMVSYDLIFIDGAHDEESIIEDTRLARYLEIPYILYDDCYKLYGDTMDAIKHFPELELMHDMDNLKLYKWTNN